jgi:FkbM family methyltransferase
LGAKILSPWQLFNRIGASGGRSASVDFISGDALLHAVLPSNQLWVAIKDVLVYEDYEFLDGFRLSRLPPGSTVLDAGAYVGLYSLKASRYAKRVVSLEPSEQNYEYLESNIMLNGVDNVEPRKVALSSTAGFSRFSQTGTTSTLTELGQQVVKTTTLDELIESVGHVDLMKLDIEGSEYEVFAACKSALKEVSRITAEIHIYNDVHKLGLRRLVATLGKNGFEVVTMPSPFQTMWYGMTKPWNCSLKRYNNGNASLYRLLLSAIYGTGWVARTLKRSMEVGSEGLLYAYRK